MELFRTDDFYIFVKGEYSLWWDRLTGAFIPKTGWDLTDADDPVCLGICQGIIGKVQHPSIFDPRLVVIKESASVGTIHGSHEVHKIKSIAFLQLGPENVELNLPTCAKHKCIPSSKTKTLFDIQKNAAFSKTLGTLKSAGNVIKNTTQSAGNVLKNTTQQAAAMATGTSKRREIKDKEKFEKQITEEFYKIFTDTNSFYYCQTNDITSSLQRLCQLERENIFNPEEIWKSVDDRFFWNKHMLRDLIDLNNPLANPWILPIIQGYIQIEECKVKLDQDIQGVKTSPKIEIFKLCILSRRSRFRAGTRYKRRGVDEDGECANYVETEQIIAYQHHEVSFVQVRGSVPVYWSQPGYKYRPPPRIDKGEAETKIAFEKHFNKEIKTYGPICVINLVDQSGKERVIWDAYSNNIFQFNNKRITYVTFDFHEYCRGMHFENVSILINSIADIVKDMNYCWRDKQGNICSQTGVFRVNCIDCLDRTNVVQTALGKAVMEIQFCKLGLITPDGTIPDSIKNTFQLLWANNGDIISKQYAGTNALKGDYTRTGERKFTGIMKDGMNSANRYYLSRFKDSTRQGTIDLMLGNYDTDDFFIDSKNQDEEDSVATAEHVKLLIEDCKKMLINETEVVLGAWGLINADPVSGDPSETEMDTILILTKDSYFIADYDDQVDKITKYQQVLLTDLHFLECGIPDTSTPAFLKMSKNHFCIRINYKVDGVAGYYHMFRSTNLRFFNNMAVVIKSEEEEIESLKAVCEAFIVALDIANLPAVQFLQGQKLERRKSKIINPTHTSGIYLDIANLPHLTRNVSETQLLALKNAGSKALSNMSHQFSKLNKFGAPFKQKKQAKFTIGKKQESSSESDDDYETSIFQPSETVGRDSQYATDSSDSIDKAEIEQGVEAMENIDVKTLDTFMPGVGIVMRSLNENQSANDQNSGKMEQRQSISAESSQVNNVQLSSIMQNVSISNTAPDIQINSEEVKSFEGSDTKLQPPNTLKLDRKHSHSSGEVDSTNNEDATETIPEAKFDKRSNSEQDVTLNISQSQSESALKNKLQNITTPVANVTKGLVLSPFSKFAKGVQNLGANLDPRKMSSAGVRQISEKEYEEHRKLQEKWQNCNTRLIAL